MVTNRTETAKFILLGRLAEDFLDSRKFKEFLISFSNGLIDQAGFRGGLENLLLNWFRGQLRLSSENVNLLERLMTDFLDSDRFEKLLTAFMDGFVMEDELKERLEWRLITWLNPQVLKSIPV